MNKLPLHFKVIFRIQVNVSKFVNQVIFMNNQRKQISASKILVFTFMIALYTQNYVRAEAGSKSMFSDEGASVMMNDNAPTTTPVRPKARTVSPTQVKTPQARSEYQPSSASAINLAGIETWIDLKDANGRLKRVSPSYTFRSGDGIKLQIKSKTDGYLYVLNQDSAGELTPLYPTNGQPSGLIQANIIYTIPPRGMIYFDNQPGNEKVTIALAKYPLPTLDPSYSSAPTGTRAGYGSPSRYDDCAGSSSAGSKGMFSSDAGSGVNCLRSNHSAGSKSMFTQEEETNSPHPASYASAPADVLDRGDVLFVDFTLNHR